MIFTLKEDSYKYVWVIKNRVIWREIPVSHLERHWVATCSSGMKISSGVSW